LPRNASRVYVPAKEDGEIYARARCGIRIFRRVISRRGPDANGYLAPAQACAGRGRSRIRIVSLLPRQSIGAPLWGMRPAQVASADLHRQLVETEECPAWKDNDQQVPEIDFAPDFELTHGREIWKSCNSNISVVHRSRLPTHMSGV